MKGLTTHRLPCPRRHCERRNLKPVNNPSSLIFVALVVVWAGWLLQHQIRRRQVLLTARTVETFSDAMRVLERREQVREPSLAIYRTSLRAGTVTSGVSPEPALLDQPEFSQNEPNEVDMTTGSTADKLQSVLRKVPTVQASRRARGIAFLAAVALFPITLVAVVAGVVGPLALLGSLMLLAAVVLWLRSAALAQRGPVRQAPARSQARRTARPSPAGAPRQASTELVLSGAVVPRKQVAEPQAGLFVAQDAPFDAQPAPVLEQEQAPQVLAESFQDESTSAAPVAIADGTWSPVQVPKPTYTMKAKAPERLAPEPASYQNTPVEDLPFDGRALDLEDEELPSAFRAG